MLWSEACDTDPASWSRSTEERWAAWAITMALLDEAYAEKYVVAAGKAIRSRLRSLGSFDEVPAAASGSFDDLMWSALRNISSAHGMDDPSKRLRLAEMNLRAWWEHRLVDREG